jgi:hypothetical protein
LVAAAAKCGSDTLTRNGRRHSEIELQVFAAGMQPDSQPDSHRTHALLGTGAVDAEIFNAMIPAAR